MGAVAPPHHLTSRVASQPQGWRTTRPPKPRSSAPSAPGTPRDDENPLDEWRVYVGAQDINIV